MYQSQSTDKALWNRWKVSVSWESAKIIDVSKKATVADVCYVYYNNNNNNVSVNVNITVNVNVLL